MKLPLGPRLCLFSNEDDRKQFARLMRNDRFGGAVQKNLQLAYAWSAATVDTSSDGRTVLSESAPPGGTGGLLYPRVEATSTCFYIGVERFVPFRAQLGSVSVPQLI